MRVLIAAGGTAGHINPGLAIADVIKQNGGAAMFVGTPNGMETKHIPAAGYGIFTIPMSGIQRRLTPRGIAHNIHAAHLLIAAELKAKDAIQKFKPDAVIGTGSYVTFPVLRAARKLRIKTALHESNAYPGMAIRLSARYADKVMLADETAAMFLRTAAKAGKCVAVGMPMRDTPVMSREAARAKLCLDDRFTILSCGGSLGAARLNTAVKQLLEWEKGRGINHIHSYGKNGIGQYTPENTVSIDGTRRIVREYIDDMYDCMAAADLVICRSGAATQAELKMLGRASVQIPYPYAAENHQYKNAAAMEKCGACEVIADKDLTGDSLIAAAERLCGGNTAARMAAAAAKLHKADAAGKIYDVLAELIGE